MTAPREIIATGTRLNLARFRRDDFEAVHAFASDPAVCTYTTWGPNGASDTQAFIEDAMSPSETKYILAVVLHDRVIGSAAVWITDAADSLGEMGYTIAPAHWGKGYATEAAQLLLTLGFGDLRLERLAATCDPENLASAKVLEKAGFRYEGRLRGHVRAKGRRRDSLIFGRLSTD